MLTLLSMNIFNAIISPNFDCFAGSGSICLWAKLDTDASGLNLENRNKQLNVIVNILLNKLDRKSCLKIRK